MEKNKKVMFFLGVIWILIILLGGFGFYQSEFKKESPIFNPFLAGGIGTTVGYAFLIILTFKEEPSGLIIVFVPVATFLSFFAIFFAGFLFRLFDELILPNLTVSIILAGIMFVIGIVAFFLKKKEAKKSL